MIFFFVGNGIGLAAAAIGAVIEYWLHLRPGRSAPAPGAPRSPSFVLFVLGSFMLAGFVAILASLVLTGGIQSAMIMGLGVFVGFNLGFFLIALIWILSDRKRQPDSAEKSPTSAHTLNDSGSLE